MTREALEVEIKVKGLYVTGKNFGGGIIFAKIGDGEWYLSNCAPYLQTVLKNIPIAEIGKHLTKKGFKWKWI